MLRDRFEKSMSRITENYTASISFDKRLYRHDVAGSIAHAKMLAKQGIISIQESECIIDGLTSIQDDIEQGKVELKSELEDIHMNIEAILVQKIGDIAGKLHTARSRNDQIALDMRLFTKEAITITINRLTKFQLALLHLAKIHKDLTMPGYTHTQRAQPILFAHHILAYFEMMERDKGRFLDCFKRADILPLGSGALAGVPYPIDRDFLAQELGFSTISNNSVDAVSDRDFLIEYEAAASITMMHLSRLAEEFILWSSQEFNFIEIDDAYTTSSSIMPQKKNPDVAELVRGKTGRAYGHLINILTMMKALPLSYNRDIQEDKEGFFDLVDTLTSTLEIFTGMVETVKVNSERINDTINEGYLLATDIADYLVKKGLPFRQAHTVVSKLVSYALNKDLLLNQLDLSEYQRFSTVFEQDVYSISIQSSIAARDIHGGTASKQVDKALNQARKKLEHG